MNELDNHSEIVAAFVAFSCFIGAAVIIVALVLSL